MQHSVLLPGEDQAAGDQEAALVQNLADTQWRIDRCARLEASALSGDTPDIKTLDVVSKHEARRCDKREGRTSDFKALGFVFSIEEIDAAIKRELAYLRANHIVFHGRQAA